MERICGTQLSDQELDNFLHVPRNEQKDFLSKKFIFKRNSRIEKITDIYNQDVEKKIFLQNLDFEWRSHLQYLEQLRQVIGLRGYGQKNPLDEYKRESFELFQSLLDKIKENLIIFLSNLEVDLDNTLQEKESTENTEEKVEGCLLAKKEKGKISRNEVCPATGKKFKQCCGALV